MEASDHGCWHGPWEEGSQIAVIAEGGELIEKRLRTERQRLRQFFADPPKARVLLEASTNSEWVKRLPEELSPEVILADPNIALRCTCSAAGV